MMVRRGWALLIFLLGCGTAPTPEPVVRPRPPEPAGPTSFVIDEEVPEVAARPAPSHPASGAPVFQRVHRGEIVDLAISDDGRLAAVVSSDGSVSLMDTATAEIRSGRRLWIRSTGNMSVRFDPTGTRLLLSTSGGENEPGSFYIWDLLTDVWTRGLQSWDLRVAALGPDGRTLATIQREYRDDYYYYYEEPEEEEEPAEGEAEEGPESTFGLRDVETGHERASHSMHDFVPTSLVWSPSGARVALHDDQEGGIQLRDGRTGDLVAAIEADEDLDWSVPVFRPNGGAMATVGSDGSLRIRNPVTGEVRFEVEPEEADAIVDARWSADGALLLLFTRGDNVRVLDGTTGEPRSAFALPPGTELYELAVSPDGSIIYVVPRDGKLHRINTATGTDDGAVIDLETGGMMRVSQDGGTAVVGSDILTFVDLAQGRERATRELGYGEHSVWGVAWAPDSHTLYTYGRAGVEQWGVQGARSTGCAGEGKVRFSSDGRARYFMAGDYDSGYCNPATGETRNTDYLPAVSGDGSAYVVEGDGGYQVIDTDTGRARHRLPDVGDTIRLSHDGRVALMQDDSSAQIVDTRTGRARGRITTPESIGGAEISPDGASVVVMHGHQLSLYAANGRELGSFEVPEEGTHFGFSRDGASVAFNADRQITLLAARTGQARATLQVDGPVREISFSRDSSRLAVVTTDSKLFLFASGDGAVAGRLELPIRHSLSPDGRSVAACRQGQVQVLDVASGRARTLGSCATAQEPVFSPDGRLLALRDGAMTHVYKVDGSGMLTLRTLRLEDGNHVLAYDGAGAFFAEPATLQYLRYRQAGPLTTAPLVAADSVPRDAQLLARFFGGAGP